MRVGSKKEQSQWRGFQQAIYAEVASQRSNGPCLHSICHYHGLYLLFTGHPLSVTDFRKTGGMQKLKIYT